jgi:hypothetical protein
MKMEQSVPKRRHINFRRRGITQKKAYNNKYLLDDKQNFYFIVIYFRHNLMFYGKK